MIDTRNDTSDQIFDTKDDFLAPRSPEQDVAWLDQKEVRASVTEAFPNGHGLSEDVGQANLAKQGSIVVDFANKADSGHNIHSLLDPKEVYFAQLTIGQQLMQLRKDMNRAA